MDSLETLLESLETPARHAGIVDGPRPATSHVAGESGPVARLVRAVSGLHLADSDSATDIANRIADMLDVARPVVVFGSTEDSDLAGTYNYDSHTVELYETDVSTFVHELTHHIDKARNGFLSGHGSRFLKYHREVYQAFNFVTGYGLTR